MRFGLEPTPTTSEERFSRIENPLFSRLIFSTLSSPVMKHFRLPTLATLSLILLNPLFTGSAAAQEKRALDHDAVENWNRISGVSLSRDGNWVLWEVGPEVHGRIEYNLEYPTEFLQQAPQAVPAQQFQLQLQQLEKRF